MSLVNATPLTAQAVPLPDHQGRDVVIAIVKAAFDVLPNGTLVRAAKPAEIRLNDECYEKGDPKSSIRLPGELCAEKQGTDVVVVGEAIARNPVTSMDVAVKVRDVTVPLRVHGERVFYQGLAQVVVGSAAPFERKGIVYEKAYGGATDDHKVMESRNPSGVGVARRAKDLIGLPAPQIEHPARPHKTASDNHPPVGFGAIWSYWTPRRELAGTMDQAWVDGRMPMMPINFDLRANNVAHPSLIFDPPLMPGDDVAVLGMSESGLLSFRVPNLRVVLRARFEQSGRVEVRPPIDTLVVLPGERRVEVVVRKAFAMGRAKDVLREIRIELA
jgi:hypothetical protein